MVSRIIIIAIIGNFLGGCWDNYFPQKEVRYKDVKIAWYWRSLGDNRRDFVEVSKGVKSEVVLNCTGTPITDIKVVNDSIVIKTRGEVQQGVYESRGSGLGIPVRIDPTASEFEWDTIYNHEFYKSRRKFIMAHFDTFNISQLSGKISYVHGWQAVVKFRLNNADGTYMFTPLMTPLNGYANFVMVAETGDSVYKPAFADTLILIKVVTKKIYKFTFRPPA
jgi:hypothetical protein